MNNIERRDKELAYISDEMILGEQAKCRKVLQKLNFMDRSNFAGIAEVVKELLGNVEGHLSIHHFTVIMVLILKWVKTFSLIIIVQL